MKYLKQTWLAGFTIIIAQLLAVVSPFATTVFAQEDSLAVVNAHVFEREDCQHCQDARVFFDELLSQRDDFEVIYYDIEKQNNRELFDQLTSIEQLPKATPVILIGNRVIQGFADAETTGVLIESLIEKTLLAESLSVEEHIKKGGSGDAQSVDGGTCNDETGVCDTNYEPYLVKVPFMGVIDAKEYSLPVLSMVLGFIDGFNPCAMWVLVTFLIVLTQAGSRKKMWTIAGLFIFAEAIMYYLILNVWFTVWDFVGMDAYITPIVGTLAIGGGLFFLYEWKTSDGACKVTSLKQRARTHKKINKLVDAEMTFFTILGVLGLAFSVNIIEFACSIGIPQAFTKIIEINGLSFWMEQWYMFLYILFYMVDDFIVFGIALYSFEKIGITTKYSKLSNLIGGILMFILGAILIFKPELLIF
jgi:glutaredoxin/cytochrome c biogenesis protein CcdA